MLKYNVKIGNENGKLFLSNALADTVAIIRHFSGKGKIGNNAKKILVECEKGETKIYISVFSFAEVLYSFEKNRISIDIQSLKHKIDDCNNYHIIDLNYEIIEEVKEIPGLELHDRLIVATARYLNIPILTPDEEIRKSNYVEVIW